MQWSKRRAEQYKIDGQSQDAREHDEGSINEVMIRFWIVLSNPPPNRRIEQNDATVGDNDLLEG